MAKVFRDFKGHAVAGDYSSLMTGKTHGLSLYGSTTCPACKSAREFLNSRGVQFNDLLVDKSSVAFEEFKSLDFNSVPVFVTSKRALVGFYSEELGALLEGI